MGFLDMLGNIAVAGMDAAMKNDNFVAGVALSRNGDRKLENFASTRNRIANATERNRMSNTRRNVEPLTDKQAMIGIGVLAAVGIAAAILNSDSKNDNNDAKGKTVTTSQTT